MEIFMKIIVNGACGRAGSALCRYIEDGNAHEVAAYVDVFAKTDASKRRFAKITEFYGDADCIIDFSHRSQTGDVCSYAVKRRLPLVVATTGQTAEDAALINAAACFVPVMKAANLSAGIVILRRLVRLAAAELRDSDIAITEIHRSGKADAPSATAAALSNEIAAVRPESRIIFGESRGIGKDGNDITVHSLRLGDCAGIHTVHIAMPGQMLTLSHESFGRQAYAEGAIHAAGFLLGKTAGVFTEMDLLEENRCF